jgi:hypothetical protein
MEQRLFYKCNHLFILHKLAMFYLGFFLYVLLMLIVIIYSIYKLVQLKNIQSIFYLERVMRYMWYHGDWEVWIRLHANFWWCCCRRDDEISSKQFEWYPFMDDIDVIRLVMRWFVWVKRQSKRVEMRIF